MSRFALQAIGEAGFGYKFNTLENDDDEYAFAVKSYLCVSMWFFKLNEDQLICNSPALAKVQQWMPLIPYVTNIAPPSVLRKIAQVVPWKNLHAFMGSIDTMEVHATAVFQTKKDVLDQSGGPQEGDPKDLMTMLSTCADFTRLYWKH